MLCGGRKIHLQLFDLWDDFDGFARGRKIDGCKVCMSEGIFMHLGCLTYIQWWKRPIFHQIY